VGTNDGPRLQRSTRDPSIEVFVRLIGLYWFLVVGIVVDVVFLFTLGETPSLAYFRNRLTS
jgi:hypothetical protein